MVNRKLLILLAIALVIFFTVMHIRYGAFAQAQSAVAARSAGTARSADAGVSSRESDFSEENEVNVNDNVTRDVTEFKVNAPINFNYKTKAEIYGIRKKFVAESLFKNPDYTPSKTVFSKIADGKQWITLEYEYYDKNSSEGYSEESRFINNPTALIMLDIPFSSVNAGKYWGEDMYLLPKSISYHKEENTIKTAYSLQKFFSELHPGLKNEFLCFLNGLNARDFGYPWVFVYQSDNVTFRPQSVKDDAVQIRQFIRLGMSTGDPRNNGSPKQEELEFRIDKFPAYLKIKLWKKQPESVSDKADIMTELYFDN